MRKISEILKFAFSAGQWEPARFQNAMETVILPPKPDDLAIAFGAALMMTGKYETPGAAATAAWFAIPDFYMARETYAREIAPMFFVSKSSEEIETIEYPDCLRPDREGDTEMMTVQPMDTAPYHRR